MLDFILLLHWSCAYDFFQAIGISVCQNVWDHARSPSVGAHGQHAARIIGYSVEFLAVHLHCPAVPRGIAAATGVAESLPRALEKLHW